MAQAKHGITWKVGGSGVYAARPGENLILKRQHDKKGEKVELRFWFVLQPLDDWKPQEATAAGDPDVVITLGDLQADKLYSGGDSTIKVKGGAASPLASAPAPSTRLSLGFDIQYKKSSLLKKAVGFDVPLTPFEKRRVLVVRAFVGGTEETNLLQRFEVFTREATWRQKMEAFLKWQDKLVYGPPTGVKLDSKKLAYWSDRRWGVQAPKDSEIVAGKVKPATILQASSSGVEDGCYVCSPLVNAFMAYWCNLHDSNFRVVNAAGSDAKAIASAYAEFFENGVTPLPPPTVVPEPSTLQELTELDDEEREGVIFKLTDAGTLPGGLKVSADDLVAFKGKKWKKTQIETPTGWTWPALYEALSKAEPGELYVCATGTHVWFMAVMGGAFTVKQKYIFNTGEDDCATGVYRIHASPAVNLAFGYRKYLKDTWVTAKITETKADIEALKTAGPLSEKAVADAKTAKLDKTDKPAFTALEKKAKKDKDDLKSKQGELSLYEDTQKDEGPIRPLSSLKAALEKLKDSKVEASKETAIPEKTIYEKLGAALKKVEDDASIDGLFAFGGTDLTLQNSQVVKDDKGKVYLDRGAGVPAAYRKASASGSFKVWKVRRIIDDKTGWLKPTTPGIADSKILPLVLLHDCRPIDSE